MQRYWHILKWPSEFAIILLVFLIVAPEEYDSSIAEPKSAVLPITLWSIENQWLNDIVAKRGIEPPRAQCPADFKSAASTNFAISPYSTIIEMFINHVAKILTFIVMSNSLYYFFFILTYIKSFIQ